MRTFIGIDPGKDGAIAFLSEDRDLIQVYPVPMQGDDYDMRRMYELLKDTDDPFCCLERVRAMPKQGVTSMFSFGRGLGIWEALLAACRIPVTMPSPQIWQRVMLAGEAKGGTPRERKQRSIQVCHRLFPRADLRKSPACRVDHSGLAEALLMAEYARRIGA